ncbi:MAG: 50S ribosomal protein L1 [Planctomycetes bacterium DG_20]|nr:MAG: 50S ribosomal protein L1 [Planctomycetes bacterium DG_20]
MPKHGKRHRQAQKEISKPTYALEEAVQLLKRLPGPKFDQSVEVHLKLGIDPKQSDQNIRGSISLPAGLGRARTVVAFCPPELADEAKKAGAVEAGADDLVAKIEGGWMAFDVAVAHPALMPKVAKLGRLLGPQGKMPTPKAGTVGPEIAKLVSDFAAGKLEYRSDAGGNVHAIVGKVSFEAAAIIENVRALVEHVRRARPASARGQFFLKAVLTATMAPGINLDLKTLPAGA